MSIRTRGREEERKERKERGYNMGKMKERKITNIKSDIYYGD